MKRNTMMKWIAGSALAIASAGAWALPPNIAPTIEIWASGASATDNLVKGLFTNLCGSTLDTYLDNSATPGSSHRAFFCSVDVGTLRGEPAPRLENVLFHKTSVGGSGNGAAPVANGALLTQMVINNNGVNGSTRATNCVLTTTANTYSCSFSGAGETVTMASDAGFSDVEPALFRGINAIGGIDITGAQVANLTVSPLNAVVFGITVNKSLRNRLQLAQNLTVGAEDAANMPTLTRSQVAAAFTGGVTNWSAFRVSSTHPLYPGLAINDPVLGTAPTSANIFVCRRTNGSGTQAQFNSVFLRAPCIDGVVNPQTAGATSCTPPLSATTRISMCSATGNLTTCMNTREASGQWAFGIHSTENVPRLDDPTTPADEEQKFRFIKIHGVTPDIKNAADSQYEDWVEQTVQWRVGNGLTNSAAQPPTPDVLAILTKIKDDGASATILATENTSYVHTWGQGGYLATPSVNNVPPTDGIFVVSNPVNTATRGGNSCRIPRVIRNTPAAHGVHLP